MKLKLPTTQYKIRKNGTRIVETINEEPSKTDPQYLEDCDINVITDRWLKTGQTPNHLQSMTGVFADVSEIPDLFRAQLLVQESQSLFQELPAMARAKFDNDPVKMFEFLKDPKNHKEAVELGLMTPRPFEPQNDESNDEKREYQPKSQKKTKTASLQDDTE